MFDKKEIENLKVRFLKDEDMPFIYNSFLKSSKHGFQGVPSDIYYSQLKLVLLNMLKTSNVLVVHVNGDPNKIIGYVIFERVNDVFVLHYIYVKHLYRNLGIAKNLIVSAGYDKEKETGLATMPIKKLDFAFYKKLGLIYSPFYLYKGVEINPEGDADESNQDQKS